MAMTEFQVDSSDSEDDRLEIVLVPQSETAGATAAARKGTKKNMLPLSKTIIFILLVNS